MFRRSTLAACFWALPSLLLAVEPAIRNVNLRGIQIGGTTTLVIDGDDFGKTPTLLLGTKAKSTLKPAGTDKQASFDIAVDADAVPGYCHLRVVTEGGVSLPVVLGVDRMPQKPVAATVDALPVALHGAVAGSTSVETKFTGKAGQKVLVEVEAARIGSKLRPVVHLTNPKKLQLAWAWATPALFGDARLEAILPEEGAYTVSVHDAEYAAPAPGFFRLKIGQWNYVDQVFPPAVSAGASVAIEMFGRPVQPQEKLQAPPKAGFVPFAFPKSDMSGPQPFVAVNTQPEYVEQPGKLQEIPLGACGISGKLSTPYEEDRYRIAVTPGVKVRFEVFAERIGSPIDTALVIRNEKGDQLLRVEDAPGTLDPVLEYVVPEKTTAVIVGVAETSGRGGPQGIYRLTVEPQGSPSAKPDFRLTTPAQRVVLPAGGRSIVPVTVVRRGFLGKIDLAIPGLPPGVRIEGATIPDNADGALVTIERTGDASALAVVNAWTGSGGGESRAVMVKGHPLEHLQPWLATEIAVAPSSLKAADFQVDWEKLPADAGLVPGMKLTLPVKIARTNPKTSVKLTLLTSQTVPLVNNQPDPNKTIRQEKPIELGEKAPTGEVVAIVPVDLPSPVYDIALQAELLASDKKPQAVTYTPVRRMAVRLPLVAVLEGPNRIDVIVDPKKGATVPLKGKIERKEGLKGDVALTFTGLPPGATAGAVTVKADATAFTSNLVLPPNLAAGEVKGIKISASAAADPSLPGQRIKARDVELTLVVKIAAK